MNRNAQALSAALILILATPPTPLHAADTDYSKDAQKYCDHLDQLRQDYKNRSAGKGANDASLTVTDAARTGLPDDLSAQAAAHCGAMQAARQAKSANANLGVAWGAVALVCGASCAYPLARNAKRVCEAGAGAALAFEIAETHKAASALDGLAQALGTLANPATIPLLVQFNDKVQGSVKAMTKKAKSNSSCGVSAFAALQAMAKSRSRAKFASTYQTSKVEVENMLGLGKSVDASTLKNTLPQLAQAPIDGSASPTGLSGAAKSTSGTSGDLTDLTVGSSTSFAVAGQDCVAGNQGNTQALVRCASAADPRLSGLLQDTAFQQAFQDLSGQSLGDLAKKDVGFGPETLAQGLAGAQGPGGSASGGGSAEGVSRLTQLLKSAEADPQLRALASIEAPGTFRTSGAAPSGTGGSGVSEDSFSQMQGLLGQLGGAATNPEAPVAASSEMDFVARQMTGRNPAAVAEDPRIGLFERVTYRYRSVSDRLK